ncbi:MAG: YkgJ family cysteine cluster protein [Stellaceae bacterium]
MPSVRPPLHQSAGAPRERSVPCGSCQFCCRKEWVLLSPGAGDVIELYETETVFDPVRSRPGKALAHKANGDCVYLGAEGCTIHSWRPSLCRAFDCRRFYLQEAAKPRRARRRELAARFKAKELFEIGRALNATYPVKPD